jgi:hypothetical protein
VDLKEGTDIRHVQVGYNAFTSRSFAAAVFPRSCKVVTTRSLGQASSGVQETHPVKSQHSYKEELCSLLLVTSCLKHSQAIEPHSRSTVHIP